MRIRCPVTAVLFGLIALAWAGTLLTGGPGELNLLRWGANAPVLVRDGQWYRLCTANFLHGSWLHIALNGFALLQLGVLMEVLVGRARYLALWLASALAGSATSAFFGDAALSVGASTALFGLLGGWAALHLRFSTGLPPPFRQSLQWWGIQLGLNAALMLAIPNVDWRAHVGGFVGGAITLLLLCPSADRLRSPSALAQVLAFVLSAGFAGAFAANAVHAQENGDSAAEGFFAIADRLEASPMEQNNLAFEVAIDPGASPELLSRALEAAEKAVAAERSAIFVDTLATLRYRMGQLDSAIALECQVLSSDPKNSDYASQLNRFLVARRSKADPPAPAATLAVTSAGLSLHLPATSTTTAGLTAVAVVNSPPGLMLLRLGAAALGQTLETPPGLTVPPGELPLDCVERDSAIPPGERVLAFRPLDPKIAAWP